MMQENEIQPVTPRGRIVKKIWGFLPVLFLIATIILIIILFSVINTKKTRMAEAQAKALANERPPTNVVLMQLSPTVIRDRINLPGVIAPWTDLELLSKIYGAVIEVPVQEGDRVAKGEVIARIDPADYRIALDAAQASYQLALANLKRMQTLFAKNLIPTSEFEKVETQVQTTKAAMDNAALQLSRCTITAPIGGVVRRLDAKAGLLLNVADPIARILQIDTVKAVVGIPESDLATVRAIETVELSIQALNDLKVVGRKHVLASSPDNKARLYNLELAVANPDGALYPGMFVRAEIVKKVAEASMIVPLYTVITRNGEQFVYVEENGVARRRPVKLGILEEWRVQVTNGLSPGNRVIVEGHRNVEEGRKVNIVRILSDTAGALP
ncbi:MAG: efflux RND transporter periplasmic adaptor subunit [Proteobacteria bacterium]|nr:efflux RND transporter periplasmic adaptor subunit [Pseudomonadota bacterium]